MHPDGKNAITKLKAYLFKISLAANFNLTLFDSTLIPLTQINGNLPRPPFLCFHFGEATKFCLIFIQSIWRSDCRSFHGSSCAFQ